MSEKTVRPSILVLDIETAPKKAFVWGLWKQNIATNQIVSDWYMLTWSAKWLHEDEVMSDKLSNYDYFDANHQDDLYLCNSLWKLLDKADIVVAHNGDRFDIPSINTRFLEHRISPPSPYKQIDTLKVAKGAFKFTSNRLDYVGQFLGLGRKIDTGGMQLWIECYEGDREAFERMEAYNKQDVLLLEDVYKTLLPWIKNHPNVGVQNEDQEKCSCPRCGSTSIQFRGYYTTNVSAFHRFKCNSCGGWGRMRKNTIRKAERDNLTLSI